MRIEVEHNQEEPMHAGEIEYEYNEGAASAPQPEPREEAVREASARLALLRKRHGSAAVAEALRRAMVCKAEES